MRRACLLAIAAAAAACGDDGATPDAPPADAPPPDGWIPCVAGDPSLPPEMELLHLDEIFQQQPLADGDPLPLVTPPQGGKVVFVGMRIKNVELCGEPFATIQAALRDPCTDRVIGIERRPIQWTVADDGFAEPLNPRAISDYANVAACPNAATGHDVDGHPYQLEVRFYPPNSAPAVERIITVTPTCLDDDGCKCECDADYVLGEACPTDPDAGVGCP